MTEHGSSYNILLIYEHILQRSAFNMTIGSFGQVKGQNSKELKCFIQENNLLILNFES